MQFYLTVTDHLVPQLSLASYLSLLRAYNEETTNHTDLAEPAFYVIGFDVAVLSVESAKYIHSVDISSFPLHTCCPVSCGQGICTREEILTEQSGQMNKLFA